jgi:hypothetical protein
MLDQIPPIEADVLATSRRELNLWFLSMRSDVGGKCGAAALRAGGRSAAVGPGTGPGGDVQAFGWRSAAADAVIMDLPPSPVTDAAIGCFDLDAHIDGAKSRLSQVPEGARRDCSAFAESFSWVGSWRESKAASLEGDLLPPLLNKPDDPDETKLITNLNTHPVHRAKSAYALLQKSQDFKQYYEKNRFGSVKVSTGASSSLSSLAGSDVTKATDRKFHSNLLPTLCTIVAGFSCIEAALELSSSEKTTASHRAQSASSIYERELISEIGSLVRSRTSTSSSTELAHCAKLLTALFVALRAVHPGSGCRRHDSEALSIAPDEVKAVFDLEQTLASKKLINEDRNEGVMKIPDQPLPFGLDESDRSVEQANATATLENDLDMLDPQLAKRRARKETVTAKPNAAPDAVSMRHSYSEIVPGLLQSVHKRVILIGWIAKNQLDIDPQNQEWPKIVLDFACDSLIQFCNACKDNFVNADDVSNTIQISQAVQVAANMQALRNSAPGFIGALARGCIASNLMRNKQGAEAMFASADEMIKQVQRACDQAEGAARDAAFQIARGKIDQLMSFSVEEAEWCEKKARDECNEYCDQLINFLRVTFGNVGIFKKVEKEGFCFGCTGHIASRIMGMVINGAGEFTDVQDAEIPSIRKINAFGVQNLSLDVAAFSSFADGCGVPQLSECFRELKCFTDALLDRELVSLCEESKSDERMSKYPMLDLLKLKAVMEKYVPVGMGEKLLKGGKGGLMLEKKDVNKILAAIKNQV